MFRCVIYKTALLEKSPHLPVLGGIYKEKRQTFLCILRSL